MSTDGARAGPGGVGKRVEKALHELFGHKDSSEAALHASIGVAATSKKEYPGLGDGAAYKAFLKENSELIWLVGTCGRMRVRGQISLCVPEALVKRGGKSAAVPVLLEDLLYTIVRCNLVHESELPGGVKFTSVEEKGMRISLKGGCELCWQIILGLLLAVVGSAKNAHERMMCEVKFQEVSINSLWGKKDEVEKLVLSCRKRKQP